MWVARLLLILLLVVTLGAFLNVAWGSPAAEEVPTGEGGQATPSGAELPSDTRLLIASLYILILAGFVGFEVIGGVSPLLHTPLMSVTNAISAISLVGSLVIAGSIEYHDTLSRVLGLVAVTAASINVVGGFMITDRMLRMFKPREARP